MTAIIKSVSSTSASRVTVTTSATRLDTANTAKSPNIIIRNRGSVAVYVGGSAVTSADGFQLDAGESLDVAVGAGNIGLYGITASGTASVHILQVIV